MSLSRHLSRAAAAFKGGKMNSSTWCDVMWVYAYCDSLQGLSLQSPFFIYIVTTKKKKKKRKDVRQGTHTRTLGALTWCNRRRRRTQKKKSTVAAAHTHRQYLPESPFSFMVITTGAAVAFHLAPSQDHYQFNSPISKREFNRAVLYSQLCVSVWCVCVLCFIS